MGWTTPRTWVSAEVATASNLNVHVRDNMLLLYGGVSGTKGSFAARQSTLQTLTTGVDLDLIFQTEDRDNESAYNNATGVWTCAISGVYTFSAHLSFVANATGNRSIYLSHSNGLVARNWTSAAVDSTGHVNVAATWQVLAGATVKVRGFQSSGGNLNTAANNDCYFGGCWVSL